MASSSPRQLPLTTPEKGHERMRDLPEGVDQDFVELVLSGSLTPNFEFHLSGITPASTDEPITFARGETFSAKVAQAIFGGTYGSLSANQKFYIAALASVLDESGLADSDLVPEGARLSYDFDAGTFTYNEEDPVALELKKNVEVQEKSRAERERLFAEIVEAGGLYSAMTKGGDDPSFDGRLAFVEAHQDEFIRIFNGHIGNDARKFDAAATNFGYRKSNNVDQNIAFLKTYVAIKKRELTGEPVAVAVEPAPQVQIPEGRLVVDSLAEPEDELPPSPEPPKAVVKREFVSAGPAREEEAEEPAQEPETLTFIPKPGDNLDALLVHVDGVGELPPGDQLDQIVHILDNVVITETTPGEGGERRFNIDFGGLMLGVGVPLLGVKALIDALKKLLKRIKLPSGGDRDRRDRARDELDELEGKTKKPKKEREKKEREKKERDGSFWDRFRRQPEEKPEKEPEPEPEEEEPAPEEEDEDEFAEGEPAPAEATMETVEAATEYYKLKLEPAAELLRQLSGLASSLQSAVEKYQVLITESGPPEKLEEVRKEIIALKKKISKADKAYERKLVQVEREFRREESSDLFEEVFEREKEFLGFHRTQVWEKGLPDFDQVSVAGALQMADEYLASLKGERRERRAAEFSEETVDFDMSEELAVSTDNTVENVESAVEAEHVRLSEEMRQLHKRNAWRGVEDAFQDMLKLRKKGVVPTRGDYYLAAQAGRDPVTAAKWGIGAAEIYRRVGMALAMPQEKGDPSDQELTEWMGDLERAYGGVSLENCTAIEAEIMPFAPDQRAAVEEAIIKVQNENSFDGILPQGSYVVTDMDDVEHTITVTPGKKVDVSYG